MHMGRTIYHQIPQRWDHERLDNDSTEKVRTRFYASDSHPGSLLEPASRLHLDLKCDQVANKKIREIAVNKLLSYIAADRAERKAAKKAVATNTTQLPPIEKRPAVPDSLTQAAAIAGNILQQQLPVSKPPMKAPPTKSPSLEQASMPGIPSKTPPSHLSAPKPPPGVTNVSLSPSTSPTSLPSTTTGTKAPSSAEGSPEIYTASDWCSTNGAGFDA